MQRRKRVVAGILLLCGILTSSALADEKEERWEFWGHKGYAVPQVSAADARKAVQESQKTWQVATVRQKWERGGAEVSVLVRDREGIIAKIGIDPQTGELLPYSVEAYSREVKVSPQEVQQKVETLLPQIEVGNRAWLGEHGRYWRIPLFWKGMLVSTVKVDALSGRLLPRRYGHDEEEED
ncbi:MAG: hypothetical protein D6736_00020 [Nitrospinota bacterium]|nr:MAG: hypothetical protein D6736_00020 [Nitrospinota bacterium]